MRLSQLHETQQGLDRTEALRLIKTQCSEILSVYRKTNMVLMRGESQLMRAMDSTILKDRTPVEMPIKLHALLHKAFLELGLTATRSNSIFCSAVKGIAQGWGNGVYIIFPKDGFSGTVFEKIKNGYAYDDLERLALEAKTQTVLVEPKNPGEKHVLRKQTPTEQVQMLAASIKELKPLEINSSNISPILKAKYADILITGTGYIGIRMDQDQRSSDMTEVLRELDFWPRISTDYNFLQQLYK